MSRNPHPRAQLSAYLDDALSTADRAGVAAHLDTCADCRSRLADLRATSALIRALPDPLPTRRLAPRLGTVPVWLAPLRTLTTLASGVSVFLFIASAVLAGLPTQTATAPTGLQAPAAASAASGSERNSFGAAGAPNASPAPGVADGAKAAAPSQSDRVAQAQTPGPRSPADARADDSAAQAEHTTPSVPQLGPSPWLWLALAIAFGAVAFAVQRRLRSV